MANYLINATVRQDQFTEAVNPGKYYYKQLSSDPAQKKMQVDVQNVIDSIEKSKLLQFRMQAIKKEQYQERIQRAAEVKALAAKQAAKLANVELQELSLL